MDVKLCYCNLISKLFVCSSDPHASSVWSGLPHWLLLLVQWLVGLGATSVLAIVASLFWPVAAIYYHDIGASHKHGQAALAVLGFVIALILMGIFLTIFLIIGLVFWVMWIIKDIAAVNSHTTRPKLFHDYYRGLFTFAE